MSRRLLVLSAVLMIAAMGILVYADPLARLSLGQSGPAFSGTTFTGGVFPGFNSTRTFTFSNSTFTFTPGSIPGGVRRAAVDTNGQIETLVAIAIAAVAIVLEFVAIFLWQGGNKPSSQAVATPSQP